MLRALLLSAHFLILAVPAAADAVRGRALSLRWCTGCHIVGPNTPGGDAGPAFATVVRRPATSFESLRNWLADPHPPMPDLALGAAEFDDIAEYILSLKP